MAGTKLVIPCKGETGNSTENNDTSFSGNVTWSLSNGQSVKGTLNSRVRCYYYNVFFKNAKMEHL